MVKLYQILKEDWKKTKEDFKKIDKNIIQNTKYLGIIQLILAGGCLYSGIITKDSNQTSSALSYVASGCWLTNGLDNLLNSKSKGDDYKN
jgi:hypothetical protein